MKKFFLSILVVIALVIGTALVAPSFIDWNAYRAEIAAEIEKATGRAIAIDGAIDVALLPAPKLSLTKARLANLEGAAKPDMVRLEALELRNRLASLFLTLPECGLGHLAFKLNNSCFFGSVVKENPEAGQCVAGSLRLGR